MTKVVRRPEKPTLWRERAVIGGAGMRGGVSLAAALAIPLQLADRSPFPDRDPVIVVAAAVIVVTLVMQGMSLPWLLRKLGIGREDLQDQERLARLEGAEARSIGSPINPRRRTPPMPRLRRCGIYIRPECADYRSPISSRRLLSARPTGTARCASKCRHA